VFVFTAAAVQAGLRAAAMLAGLLGERDAAAQYQAVAEQMKEAIERHFFSPEHGRFLRGWTLRAGQLVPDATPESSVAGLFLLGVLPADHPHMAVTMERLQKELWVGTRVGGVARYFRDYYFYRGGDFDRIPGNPWVICTLWLAQWHIRKAKAFADLEPAKELLQWAVERALPTGVLAEQYHPETGELLSVAPLTWSHATFVWAVLDYLERHRAIRKRQETRILIEKCAPG